MKANGKLEAGGRTWTLTEAYEEVDRLLQPSEILVPDRTDRPERCLHPLLCWLVEPVLLGQREEPTDARRLEIFGRARKFWQNSGHKLRDPSTPFDGELVEAEGRVATLKGRWEAERAAEQREPVGSQARLDRRRAAEQLEYDLSRAGTRARGIAQQRSRWRVEHW